jgi:hypothetical protein
MEAVSSNQKLRMRHAVVMNYPFKMKDYFAAREKC